MTTVSNQSSLVFCGIAPHPPIMVPEVGGKAISAVRESIEAMEELCKRLSASGAETVILISPHARLEADSFVAYPGPSIFADFENFRAPETSFSLQVDLDLLKAITTEAAIQNYSVQQLDENRLDHGTSVPLYFLLHSGWHGKVVALGYSFLSNDDHLAFGSAIKRAVNKGGRRIAFIASGDLSHRLKPDAPAGYNPEAYFFDDEVVASLVENDPKRIVKIDPNLRKLAGECGYRSLLVAIGAIDEDDFACDVISYEAPFGVGYLVAQLTNQTVSHYGHDVENQTVSHYGHDVELPALARQAVETFVREGKVLQLPTHESRFLQQPAACFVSVKTRGGELRGCIGTIEPARASLAEELVANAINAVTKDPRFYPVEEKELSDLRYSVDVLSPPEATTLADLNPQVYGVIVEDELGSRRGLLLPDIAGVDTSLQQVEIATRKAGIEEKDPVRLYRFKVERFKER